MRYKILNIVRQYSLFVFALLLVLFPVLSFSAFAADVEPNETIAVVVEESPTSSEDGFYYSIFDVFSDFFYGKDAILTAEQNMVLTILATTAVLFVVIVPFLVVFYVIRLICGG